ncbi:MAG: hypothetical protein M0Q92_09520 [Methanoregula sp.]|jgi:hypothetical protein|nr:hypothetical protein [Methanoregula sp.]
MTGLSSIPDDVKWRIAAEFSAQLPALYDKAFRSAVGDQYDEMEQEIWIDVARTAFVVAGTLSLPVGTAKDLAETMRTVMVILFGPGFGSETLEISKDGAVIIVRRCPILSQGYESGMDGNRMFRKCMAFTLTGIPLLNKNFSARFVRTMCTGERQCEIKVQKCDPTVPAAAKK